ncbi:MAG TPA: sigma-70 family RNA polymerase sigma factor [Chloroflexi bacterium]|nr:sigma-70 family RNA polymerase sigma factor [Chloroflexota bacterium]
MNADAPLWREVDGVENESDAALIARAKEDPEAFGILYERYVSQIYRYLYYRTGSHEDAEDLTARTFYRALRRFPHYVDRGAPFTAWLYRIAHNVVVNWMRDRQRRPVVPLESVTVPSEEARDPHAVAEMREETEELLRAVRRLPPDRQQLLILKFVEGMSNAEIAQVMGRTEGAIKALYHRTLVALREELGQEARSGKRKAGDRKQKDGGRKSN